MHRFTFVGLGCLSWIACTVVAPALAQSAPGALRGISTGYPAKTIRLLVSDSAGDTPEAFTAFIKREGDKWGSIIRGLGLKAD